MTAHLLAQQGTLLPSSIVVLARDYAGRRLGVVVEPHDGTADGIRAAAGRAQAFADLALDASHVQSLIAATDETGTLRWIVSPNLVHVAMAGTTEARDIYGR
jgi:hypothetical protein